MATATVDPGEPTSGVPATASWKPSYPPGVAPGNSLLLWRSRARALLVTTLWHGPPCAFLTPASAFFREPQAQHSLSTNSGVGLFSQELRR